MAHKSLSLKLEARTSKQPSHQTKRKLSESSANLLKLIYSEEASDLNVKEEEANFVKTEMKIVNYENNEIKDQNFNLEYKKVRNNTRTSSLLVGDDLDVTATKGLAYVDNRVDKVYTVGCFDLFHHGHVKLIERMREIGKKVIVGVHDSRRYLLNSVLKQ